MIKDRAGKNCKNTVKNVKIFYFSSSENDSGIDSLRHYQSPYNSYASSVRRLEQNNEGNCIVSSQVDKHF